VKKLKKDEPKKEKAETIIQSVKEQEEPTQAVLQSVTTPSKVNFKKSFRTNNTSNIKTSVVDTVDNPVSETSSQPENVIVPNAPK
jgi:hypothetical protein